jgi:hypothetical protein
MIPEFPIESEAEMLTVLPPWGTSIDRDDLTSMTCLQSIKVLNIVWKTSYLFNIDPMHHSHVVRVWFRVIAAQTYAQIASTARNELKYQLENHFVIMLDQPFDIIEHNQCGLDPIHAP